MQSRTWEPANKKNMHEVEVLIALYYRASEQKGLLQSSLPIYLVLFDREGCSIQPLWMTKVQNEHK